MPMTTFILLNEMMKYERKQKKRDVFFISCTCDCNSCICSVLGAIVEDLKRRKSWKFNMKTKYRNSRSSGFDSRLEKKRYDFLSMLEKSGKIKNLRTQVRFVLQESFRDPAFGICKGGEYKLGGGISYIADFVYNVGNQTIIEDVKGFKTDSYRIKKSLLLKSIRSGYTSFFEITKENVNSVFY